jgi:hypothetical protein
LKFAPKFDLFLEVREPGTEWPKVEAKVRMECNTMANYNEIALSIVMATPDVLDGEFPEPVKTIFTQGMNVKDIREYLSKVHGIPENNVLIVKVR